jgi:NAD(P)-dependent dehydrogenase (short-subunit alcohol dehydrogenase family)
MGVLDGKVALVTGAARGVGEGIARALAKEGASVAVVDVLAEEGEATAAALRELGADAQLFECDIRDVALIAATVDAVVARFGTVDILVNNAIAVRGVGKPLQEVTDDEYEQVFETGPRATFAFMRACHPHLRDGGRVVNLRSGSEFQGLNGYSHYIASKSAVGGLTRAAAREWGRDGITVNAVAPFSLSPAAAGWFADKPDELAKIVKGFAIPRPGDAELDIGRAVVYLVGPDASYVTGLTLSVDGGAVFSA